MDAQDLARWTRFAGKGGIGKCSAIIDCVAQEMGEDLMFLKVRICFCITDCHMWSTRGHPPKQWSLRPLSCPLLQTPVKYTGCVPASLEYGL